MGVTTCFLELCLLYLQYFFGVVLTYLCFVFRSYDSVLSFRTCAVAPRGPHLLTVVATVEYPTWVKQVSDPLLLPPPPPPLPRRFFLRSRPMAIPPLVTSPADVASPPPPPPPPPPPEPGEQQLQSANRQKCVQLFERERIKSGCYLVARASCP